MLIRRPWSPYRRKGDTPMVSALFTAFALIAAGQVESGSMEGAGAPKVRSELATDDPIARIERLLRDAEPDRGEG